MTDTSRALVDLDWWPRRTAWRTTKLITSLKGINPKRANAILAQTENPFWQEERYDREVPQQQEFDRIRFYVECNPVPAGLAREPSLRSCGSLFHDVKRIHLAYLSR